MFNIAKIYMIWMSTPVKPVVPVNPVEPVSPVAPVYPTSEKTAEKVIETAVSRQSAFWLQKSDAQIVLA